MVESRGGKRTVDATLPFAIRNAVGRVVVSHRERVVALPEGEEVSLHPNLRFLNQSKSMPVAVASGVNRVIPECLIDRSPIVHLVQLYDRPIYAPSGAAVGGDIEVERPGPATVKLSLSNMIAEISKRRGLTPSTPIDRGHLVMRYTLEASQLLAQLLYMSGHFAAAVSMEEEATRILSEAQKYATNYARRVVSGEALPLIILTESPDTTSPKPS